MALTRPDRNPMDTDTDPRLLLSEYELRQLILKLKDERDALRYGDPAWYEKQYAVYAANQDLMWLQKAKKRQA